MYQGIADKPNCAVELGGPNALAPHLTYSIRLFSGYKPEDFPFGQLLIDYGSTFFEPGERCKTRYDPKAGPFREGGFGSKMLKTCKVEGPGSTIGVGFWEAVSHQRLGRRDTSDPIDLVDYTGDDEDEGEEEEDLTEDKIKAFLQKFIGESTDLASLTKRNVKKACKEEFGDSWKQHKQFITETAEAEVARLTELGQTGAEDQEETPKKAANKTTARGKRKNSSQRQNESNKKTRSETL